MSIHTILSQMEEEFDKEFGARHTELTKRIILFFRSFATRIVEEVGKELVLADYFDKDMRWTKIHELIKMRVPISASDRDYYMKPFTDIRTKLQKMKG